MIHLGWRTELPQWLLLGGTAFLMVYSYLIWRDAPDKMPPAGTLPAEEPEAGAR